MLFLTSYFQTCEGHHLSKKVMEKSNYCPWIAKSCLDSTSLLYFCASTSTSIATTTLLLLYLVVPDYLALFTHSMRLWLTSSNS